MRSIVVAGAWGFSEAGTGRRVVPVGCNYYDPDTRCWAPRIWSRFDATRVRDQCASMARLGVTVARVFCDASCFMPTVGALSDATMAKLEAMLEAGAAHGNRFILSGLPFWEAAPTWWRGDCFADAALIELQCVFWRLFAQRLRGDGRIFAFDLRNEPVVGWDGAAMRAGWNRWLAMHADDDAALATFVARHPRGEAPPPPDAPAPGDRVLYGYQCFRESLATAWVRAQAMAIRRVDATRLW